MEQTREQLQTDLSSHTAVLTPGQLLLLIQMAEALGQEVKQVRSPDSDIITDRFADYFRNRLLLHHATSEEKFKKKTFEHAFRAAAEHDGHKAVITSMATHAGADVVLNDRVRFSLKTEASKAIQKKRISISKFSEARWIRDCETPEDFRRETLTRMGHHLSAYDRVVTLRAMNEGKSYVRYDFVEIPMRVLQRIETLTAADFSRRTPAGSSSATVRDDDGSTLFGVVLDGSVEKITVRGLPVDACHVHASWVVPTVEGGEG